MAILFISDLHLNSDDTDLIDLVVQFLKSETGDIEALYILGDLFNTWLGDDIVPIEFEPLILQLKQLQQAGIAIYLMVGNRDFMLGQHFAQRAGCELLDDNHVINLYGTTTLLLHGDTLCTDDVSYQRYRRWTRNKLLQWCFLHLSARYRQSISDKIKQKSRQQKQTKSADIMDVNANAVDSVMQRFGVSQLIHGHTHRPAIHQLMQHGKLGHRIVLGDWDNNVSYLKCSAHHLKLVDYRIDNGSITLSNS